MTDFYSRLNYSIGNEDWRVEKKALQIEPGNHVLCITASGDRPLHLLLDPCKNVTSIDANPIQNHLLKLKCAAMQKLDYENYVCFLGAKPSNNRGDTFQRLLHNLEHDCQAYWKNNQKKISKGILYQGDVERLTKLIALAFWICRPKKMKQLFSFEDLEEQKQFIDKKWNTTFLKNVFRVVLSRRLSELAAIDPGLYTSVDPNIELGSYIYDRMTAVLKQGLAKENLLVSLILRGYLSEEAFPPYLTKDGFEVIKERIDRLNIKTENALEHLEKAPENTYDRFSMSDIASYMDQATFDRMLKNIHRTAKPGARFCIRQFSSNHTLSPEYAHYFCRDTHLENQLEKDESCFVYRFIAGTIKK